MDKETDTVKADELNKLTKKVYGVALLVILIGLAIVVIASIIGLKDVILIGSLGIIIGITSIITARKSRKRISFTMAKVGRWLSIVSIIVVVFAWAGTFAYAFLYSMNPANN